MKQSLLSQRVVAAFLAAKIELEFPETWHVTRTRAGSEQRAQGAFSWFLHSDETHLPYDLGGFWPASLCARPGHNVSRLSTGNLVLTPPLGLIQGFSPASWRHDHRKPRPEVSKAGYEALKRFYGL